jgi:protein-tyrosine-phosphatase
MVQERAPVAGPPLRVLILCTGNSARSQMAEALLRWLSGGRAEVRSAGTAPKPEVHPEARATLARRYGLDAERLVPKPVDRFLGQPFDYVITVCDRAAETCPVFPGSVRRLHWSLADPAAAPVAEQPAAFERTAAELEARLRAWLGEPDVDARLRAANDRG